jgi:hypothetical protein
MALSLKGWLLVLQPAYSEWSRFEEGAWKRIKGLQLTTDSWAFPD